jgi:hypothetical protein
MTSTIDYDLAKRRGSVYKAKLTRALRSADDVGKGNRVLKAVAENIVFWDEVGAWPDDWHRWQAALDEVYGPFFTTVDQVAERCRKSLYETGDGTDWCL